jgi:hypothetical protein
VNLFFDDYKDAQDSRIEFHYSWLIIIIALVGWRQTKFSMFFQRIGKCCVSQYATLWHTSTAKERKDN